MTSRSLRANLEKWKNGGTVSSDDDDDEEDNQVADTTTNAIYDEDEQDNYCDDDDDLDDFVVNDADVGYKASAHQQRDRQRQSNRSGHAAANNTTTNNNSKRQRNTQQTQSYNIQRKKRTNANANANNASSSSSKQSSSQAKSQSTISSFFSKQSTATTTSPRHTNMNNKRVSNGKPTKKKNDDAFMESLLANMDDDEDDDDDMNAVVNKDDDNDDDDDMLQPQPAQEQAAHNTQPQTQFSVPAMDGDDDDMGDDVGTQCFADSQLSVQSHAPAHATDEPPKKRFRLNTTAAEAATPLESKQMEEDAPAAEEAEPDIEAAEDAVLFTAQSAKTEAPAEPDDDDDANTDQFPQSKDGALDFFWFDAYEDPIRHPGQIYLFGKTLVHERGEWQSVCVLVRNINRTFYVLPRLKNSADDAETGERVDFAAVHEELNAKRQRLGVQRFMSMPDEKKYCFRARGEGVPASAVYLKVCYSFEDPPFEGGAYTSGATYERVFGVRSTALELFLLQKQVMGPCWLRVPCTQATKIVSWCKRELDVDDPTAVTLLSTNYPSPSLTVLSLSFQTILNDKKEHEIGCISAVLEKSVPIDHSSRRKGQKVASESRVVEYFTLLRKLDRNPLPYDLEAQLSRKHYKLANSTLKTFGTERDLLSFFTTRVQSLDPDALIGHKLYDFVLDVVLHRMQHFKISTWSKLGRLRRGKIPFLKNGTLIRKYLGCGRLLVDTFISAQEFQHHKTYSLSFLVEQLLGVTKHENFSASKIGAYWLDGKLLSSLVTHCCNDSHLILQLMHKLEVLPLTKQLTNLCGNLWNRSLTSQRAERNEWLLLHEFHRSGYIVPERLTRREKEEAGIVQVKTGKKRGKAQYAGGLVFEPVRGLYDKYVLCLDFNSLYPSIIQEYNLCFTSMQHWLFSEDANENEKRQQESGAAPQTGILPKIIGVLLSRRQTVKTLLKNAKLESERKRFDIQQQALKLVANSMYGCLGFDHSRFYCKCIAALITALGRDALTKAAEMAATIGNLKVIYGDTDSIFVYTDSDKLLEARAYGTQIKKKVNKTYKKMYLEIDYVFSKMLLCRKKKYAALKVIGYDARDGSAIQTMREVKGLDFVRRDWSGVSKEIGGRVLDIILAHNKQIDEVVEEIYELLRGVKADMDENRVELKKFIITKKLTKQPKDYPDPTKQPHVMVAMEMQKMGMSVQTGSFIEYIICTTNRDGTSAGGSGGGSKSIAQRAYHLKEIEKSMAETETPQPQPTKTEEQDEEPPQSQSQVLLVDRAWYLEQQILPPVTRYCDPIEGADAAQLARALGLDGKKYAHLNAVGGGGNKAGAGDGGDDLDMDDRISRITDRLKYRETCSPLKIECKHCGASYDFCGVFDFNKMDAKCGLVCATQNCKGLVCVDDAKLRQRDISCLKNGIALQIWHFIYAYYGREWICIDPTCNYKTRQLSSTGNGVKCPKIGCNSSLKETYTASQLFDQLKYFSFLFDRVEFGKILKQEQQSNKKWENVSLTSAQDKILDELNGWIKQTILQKSRYYFLDSTLLFKYLGSA